LSANEQLIHLYGCAMAQYLKQKVQDRIANAALEVFSQKGFPGATMADIATAAGVSTGNIYRYYRDKSDLFYSLLPRDFVSSFVELMRQRVQVLDRVEDLRQLGQSGSYHLISDDLLSFCIKNRLRVVVLLGKSQGTRYDGFAEELSQVLIMLALAHFKALQPGLKVTSAMSFNLDLIYLSFSSTTVEILRRFTTEEEIREAMGSFSRYHMEGLKGFFR
jgi:AcrR family transcriptional regulator